MTNPFFNFAIAYANALKSLFAELWAYFLIGFLIAGLIAEFVPRQSLLRYLGKNSLGTLLRATLSGTVASLCSCGAIPIAVTLRKQGATRAAALTFLLAAPWAGLVQLTVFYKFLGLTGTTIIFLGALTVAFLTGVLIGCLEDRAWFPESLPTDQEVFKTELNDEQKAQLSLSQRILRALKQAGQAFGELWKYLGFGLLLAAGLKAFIPTPWIIRYLGVHDSFNPVFLAVPVAAMVELCSEGFSVFAGQLYQMGATLAVVFVIVLVGVTTDFTELFVIWTKFGKRCAIVYLLTATGLTLGFALLIQKFLAL